MRKSLNQEESSTSRVESETISSIPASIQLIRILTESSGQYFSTIVLVAIQDEAYRYGRYYKYVLRRLKIHPRRIRLGYRSSLALIGYVGGHRPSWLRYMSRRQKRGPSSVVSRIPLGRGMLKLERSFETKGIK